MSLDDGLGEEITHESFGTVSIGHATSHPAVPLFGSSIRHSQVIRLRVNRASLRRKHHNDYVYSGERIVEVELSPAQFAEFITSPNRGDGVPCTIIWANGTSAPPTPFMSKREQFSAEFKDQVRAVAGRLDRLTEFVAGLQEKPSVTKRDRADLAELVRMARQEISSNMPFVVGQFDEQMDHSVREAKAEIEAFCTQRVMAAGLQLLADPSRLALTEVDHGGSEVGGGEHAGPEAAL